jgi:hypothetical protein
MAPEAVPAHRPRVVTAEEARALVEGVVETLSALSQVIGEETQLMRDGAIADALACEPRKTALAGAYMRGLEVVKANAVALARFTPEGVQRLKGAHAAFGELIETNQTVLATARAVSETIIRDLAKETGKLGQPQGYARTGYGAAAPMPAPRSAGPIVVSKRL